MKTIKLDLLNIVFIAVAFTFMVFSLGHSQALADTIIYESATLGQTDLTILDMSNQSIPGSNVRDSVFQGVRFYISNQVSITKIGGHFVANEGGGTFFGAIVGLSGNLDFPDSANLSSPDVIGSTQLTFPNPSAEVFGDVALELQSGWYAVVFGGGLFSSTGTGAAVQNGVDVDMPSCIGWQPIGPDLGWLDYSGGSLGHRYVIMGDVIPEPGTGVLLLVGSGGLLFYRAGRSR